jgi:hypothetical protein
MVKGWVEEWLSPPDELADAAVEPDVFSDYFLSLPNVKTQNGFKQYKTTYLGKLKDTAKEIETKQKIADIERGGKNELLSVFDKYVLELEPLMQEMGFNPNEGNIQRWEAFRMEKSEHSKAKKHYKHYIEKKEPKRCTKNEKIAIQDERVTRFTRDTGGKKVGGRLGKVTAVTSTVNGALYKIEYDDDGKMPKEEQGVPDGDVNLQTCQCSVCTLSLYLGKQSDGKDSFDDNKGGKAKADEKENASFFGRRDKYLKGKMDDFYPVNLDVPTLEPKEKIEYKPLIAGDSYDKEGAEMYCTLKKNIKLFPKYETQMLQFEKFKTIMRTNQAIDVLQLEYERIKDKDAQYKLKLEAQLKTEQEHETAKSKAGMPPQQIQELKDRLSNQKAETKQLELDGWEKNFLKKCAVVKKETKDQATAHKQSYDKFVFKTCCKEPLSCKPAEKSGGACFSCCAPGLKKQEDHQTDKKKTECTGNQDWKDEKTEAANTEGKSKLPPITWEFPRHKSKLKNICKAILSEKRKVVVKLESALTEPLREYFGQRVSTCAIDFSSANINMFLWANVVCIT